ncbi:hypothetical protein [Candidatus Sodalis pierantonius]|uniref:hypothetical protein n=1 Tax=Candidatus Sodalis pierantonii TaxID=1486991 RepID=UPI00046D5DBD|nr:hypothetical protein [Candidatus Sodalis pierantonius]
MSVHHKAASTNTHLIAAMTQAGAVIHYLTIRGVSVKSVILHNCKSVIRIEHHPLCEQLLKQGQADYITVGKNAQGGFKQGAFMKGGCKVIWSTSLH